MLNQHNQETASGCSLWMRLITCKHFTRLSFRFVSLSTTATPNNNLLIIILFSSNRGFALQSCETNTSKHNCLIILFLHWCNYMCAHVISRLVDSRLNVLITLTVKLRPIKQANGRVQIIQRTTGTGEFC